MKKEHPSCPANMEGIFFLSGLPCCFFCLRSWTSKTQALVQIPTQPFSSCYLGHSLCSTCAVPSHSVRSNSATPWTVGRPGSSVHGESPGKNTGLCCHALLQGNFPTQGLNPCLLHCRQILYLLSHKGSPRILEWVAYPFSRGSFPTQESNQGLLRCRQILYQLSYPGSPMFCLWNVR